MISLPYKILAALVLALAGILAVIAYGHHRYAQGVADQQAKDQSAQAIADRAAATQAQQHVTDAAAAGHALAVQIETTLPKIEVATHDTAQRIRTIYLAAPGAAGGTPACDRPDGVQQQLDEAIARANAAAVGDLRPDPAGPAPAASAAPARAR
ncbi:hypothetical protein ACO2Q2_16515 [Dyella sp. KRB-257]|uniref:hypothetical protein n=1 Tax=Dyella sp. KRB-257 TaxID=3400915 RepID=UPI003C0FA66D